METITDFGDQWKRNNLDEMEKRQKMVKRCLMAVSKMIIRINYSKLLQSCGSVNTLVSMKTQRLCSTSYKDFKLTKSKLYERNILPLSKSSSKKKRSLCLFPNQKKVWKQELRSLGAHIWN